MRRNRLTTLTFLITIAGFIVWGFYTAIRQPRLNRELAVAVINRNAPAVRKLLAAGADPNTHGGGDPPLPWGERFKSWFGHRTRSNQYLGTPVLIRAACNGENGNIYRQSDADIEIVRLLLAAGADVNARNDIRVTGTMRLSPPRDTALLSAILLDHNSTVALLIKAGANVNATDLLGETALCRAVEVSNISVIRLLISENADVNSGAGSGWTPMMYAARNQHPESVRLLIAAGADATARSKNGRTPLMEAASSGQPENVRILLAHKPDINAHDDEGSTALMLASWNNDPEAARLLIAAGADVNARDDKRHTALWYATGQLGEKKLLLQSGVKE